MKQAVVIASVIGFFGSILAIVLGYTHYGMLGISIGYALETAWKWPLFSMPLFLTTLSISTPFVAYFFRVTADPKMSIAMYAFGYLWLLLLAFYPGTHTLGVVSDGAAAYTLFGVCIAQYLAAKVVLKAIEGHAVSRAV